MFRPVILALALFGSSSASMYSNNTEHMQYAFEAFKNEHGKTYASSSEEASRFAVFTENMKIVDERNAAEKAMGGSATHGITKFSDLTQDEFSERFLTSVPPETPTRHNLVHMPLEAGATASADWRGKFTSPVKNQGYCGSCWAFSATEQIESDAMRTLGDSYVLSPGQITQCDSTSYGCQGGWTENAYSYVKSAGGIETESQYPYPSAAANYGITGSCSSSSSGFKVKVNDYYTLSGESSMASYMGSTGPISVCLDASSWNSYTGGVMSSCGTSVDHCVQAVGLNSASGYWIVRNSWGTSWGESGYIYLKYGSNTCDITNDPTYVSVSNV